MLIMTCTNKIIFHRQTLPSLITVLGQVENQKRAHPVIGEAFPHLCEEENEEPLGMPKDGARAVAVRKSR